MKVPDLMRGAKASELTFHARIKRTLVQLVVLSLVQIPRRDDHHAVAASHKRLRQRPTNIRQTTRLRPRRDFARHKHNLHRILRLNHSLGGHRRLSHHRLTLWHRLGEHRRIHRVRRLIAVRTLLHRLHRRLGSNIRNQNILHARLTRIARRPFIRRRQLFKRARARAHVASSALAHLLHLLNNHRRLNLRLNSRLRRTHLHRTQRTSAQFRA
mmetsp:Transcript_3704/g.12380  ORF Transcript_3704/g.12380 Transcript_3704/m.12380 type:complete len:213 (+) Transcript_3704:1414-2052(+)